MDNYKNIKYKWYIYVRLVEHSVYYINTTSIGQVQISSHIGYCLHVSIDLTTVQGKLSNE